MAYLEEKALGEEKSTTVCDDYRQVSPLIFMPKKL